MIGTQPRSIRPLVLPNAWDAASAKAVAAAGFRAVATTSGGVAQTLGHNDHEQAPVEEMLAAASRMIRSVDVPVTVDFEAGYALEPEELVVRLQEIGASGAKYEGAGVTFWEHHGEATITWGPGAKELRCTRQ